MADAALTLHASAVSLNRRGCLIVGAAGTGKSTLARKVIALGGRLIADDQVHLTPTPNGIELAAPANIAGLLEVCGTGILRVPHGPAPLELIVDLNRTAPRLPPRRFQHLLGHVCPVILGAGSKGLAATVSLILRHGFNVAD